METVDGIILGSGHNSLVLQAYLAKAGLDVVCLEQGPTIGGGLATVEWPESSGFLHNTHSFFHRGITRMPWFRELELERHGASYLQPDLNVAVISDDGQQLLEWRTNFDDTLTSFEKVDSRDAETLKTWRTRFQPIVREILEPEAQRPPLPPAERERQLRETAHGRLLLETAELSPLEFVQREFRHPFVQAALLFFNGLREVDLTVRGFGHHIPALLASDGKAQMCAGGSANLAKALVSAIEEAGGRIFPDTTPTKIDGLTVETDRGVFKARKFVASGLNPQQTFLELLEPQQLPVGWRGKAENFRYNLLAPLFALNVNLSEPPRYANSAADEALMVVTGVRDIAQFEEIVASHKRGEIPPSRVMWGSCPSQFDSTQSPPDKHTAFMWEKLPYRLNWDERKSAHGEVILAEWRKFAPNLESAVVDWLVSSPLDTERRLPNMREGDLLVGAFAHGQVGFNRPFSGAGAYRTAIDGLYLCGGSCHPGGNVTGLPGYNCAQVILADHG
ncbi:MAG: phytoene dehydrogenase-like protein [Verrucomicrobiales bacterium]|jgi:phytoene dehydrogenase-like protein